MNFLRKQTRSHKYREFLSPAEIKSILSKHVLEIHSIPKLKIDQIIKYPEVDDEYNEKIMTIVANARHDLQTQFQLKLKSKFKNSHHGELCLKEYLKSI